MEKQITTSYHIRIGQAYWSNPIEIIDGKEALVNVCNKAKKIKEEHFPKSDIYVVAIKEKILAHY